MIRHDRLADPPKDEQGKVQIRYSCLDNDGIGGVGQRVQNNDIYLNKQSPGNAMDNRPNQENATVDWRDTPTVYRSPLDGYIDKVLITDSDQDQMIVKVLMRQTRVPELGDKFSSRHGQKGVCSQKYPAIDMPFSESGMQPDVIINPHAFPSRMTIGMFVESLAGKAGAVHGLCQDATPFTYVCHLFA